LDFAGCCFDRRHIGRNGLEVCRRLDGRIDQRHRPFDCGANIAALAFARVKTFDGFIEG
jgi:hypothetical protein